MCGGLKFQTATPFAFHHYLREGAIGETKL